MTPIDAAILVAAKNVIKIWQKTGTDSQRGLERVYLLTVYRTIDVERTCRGGWTEHTQQLMKESFPEKFVFMVFITVVTATLWSTYGIAALSLYTDWNRSNFVPAGTVEKVRGWNTNLVFKNTVYHYTLIFSRLFNLPLNQFGYHEHDREFVLFKEFSFRILRRPDQDFAELYE